MTVFMIVMACLVVTICIGSFLLLNRRCQDTAAYQNQYLWVKEYLKGVPHGIKLANFGSTYSRYAFGAVDEMNLKTFNFALQSQSLAMDRKLLKQFLRNMEENCIVLFQVNPCVLLYRKDDLNNQRQYYDIVRCRWSLDRMKYCLKKNFPLLCNPKILKKLIRDDSLRDSIYAGQTLILDEASIENRMADVVKVWTDLFKLQDLKCSALGEEQLQRIQENFQILDDMVSICMDAGLRPVIVSTPYSKYLNAHFSDGLVKKVLLERAGEIAQTKCIPFVHLMDAPEFQDAPECYIDGGFCMNEQGSKRFIHVLAQRLELYGIILNNEMIG